MAGCHISAGYADECKLHMATGAGWNAYRSGWNAENHVKYTQDHPNNQTIKGIYQKLDSTILYDSRYEDSSTVRYLCFWENGADISWSVPKLFIYELYVPAFGGRRGGSYL